MPIFQFFSHAKLLLTGEYLVLSGSKALALPLRFGQTLTIEENSSPGILDWKAMEFDKIWFHASIQMHDLSVIESTDIKIAARLEIILRAARAINPHFINESSGFLATTNLNFNRDWGLGTSSTLLSNIAWWAGVDPYTLHWMVSDGSGYDIACSRETQPLIYSVENHNPCIQQVLFAPSFKENIYFVYLGKKQDSAASIKELALHKLKYKQEIQRITEITELFAAASSLQSAIELMEEHEQIIARTIGRIPVKIGQFSDFPGAVKSLGAWGGDFVMVLSEIPRQRVYDYFKQRGKTTIFMFEEMI